MAIPPPPPPGPPGPPPPPIGGLKSSSAAKPSGSGDVRSALLESIQQGRKLKKTVTNDKSAPVLSGKVSSNNSNSSNNSSTNSGPTRLTGSSSNVSNGMPKLGGIFEGMSTMPKLKPVGSRSITNRSSPPNETPSTVNQSDTNTTTANSFNNSNGPMDFNAELTKHLTLKKQKKQQQEQQQQQQTQTTATKTVSQANRGPPPQPPTKLSSSTASSVENNINSTSSVQTTSYLFKQQQQTSTNNTTVTVKTNVTAINGVAPNKSSLFGKGPAPTVENLINSQNSSKGNNGISNIKSTINKISSNNDNNNNNLSLGSNNTGAVNKPVPNYGKPNCAPKPPGIQQIIAAKNGNGTRPAVSRHHSMRSPRSPPITVANGPVFPSTQHFGTLRGAPPAFQSQDTINSTSIRQAPNPPISRPTVAPPRPPNIVPPPPPIRSISNTNLTTLPLSVAPSNYSTNFGSATNVSTLKEQFTLDSQIGVANSVNNVSTLHKSNTTLSSTSNQTSSSTTELTNNYNDNNNLSVAKERSPNGSAPPLPPHRTCPTPPPPIRQTSITQLNNGGAPPVPQRHSSMRNSNQNATLQQTQITRTITRDAIDFGLSFHNVTEFPVPSPFTNLPKAYPSRNIKTTTVENRKAKAPSPPVKNDKYYLQLGDDKLCSNDTSCC